MVQELRTLAASLVTARAREHFNSSPRTRKHRRCTCPRQAGNPRCNRCSHHCRHRNRPRHIRTSRAGSCRNRAGNGPYNPGLGRRPRPFPGSRSCRTLAQASNSRMDNRPCNQAYRRRLCPSQAHRTRSGPAPPCLDLAGTSGEQQGRTQPTNTRAKHWYLRTRRAFVPRCPGVTQGIGPLLLLELATNDSVSLTRNNPLKMKIGNKNWILGGGLPRTPDFGSQPHTC